MLQTKKNMKSKWNNILKYSILPAMTHNGGHKKSKKKLSTKLGLKKTNILLNKNLKGGFIRGGSTQFFPINCTNLNNNHVNDLQGYNKQLFHNF